MQTLSFGEIAGLISAKYAPEAVAPFQGSLVVGGEHLLEVASYLRDTPQLDFDYLISVTAVDYRSHFEVVYHLTSLQHSHSLVLRVRCPQNKPLVPSLVSLWRGAELQEREIFDLMGVGFAGHPNLKRIFLWDGFKGHPLRKDYSSGT